jgi:outer membrane lipoprotein-sorting protein
MFKKLLFLLVLTSSTFLMTAQTVDEILTNYFENTGGMDNWEKLKGQELKGTMYMQGMEFPGTLTTAAPNLQRMEFTVQGMTIVQAYDGETAWAVNPFQTGTDPQRLPDEMAEDMVDQDYPSIFMNYKEKGHALELEGNEEVEGTECYKIKVTKKSGNVEYHFFDTEYYIPVMVRTIAKAGPTKGQAAETFVSEYQEVDGMMIPHSIETKMGGQSVMKIAINTVTLNPELADEAFAFPGEKDAVEEAVEEEAPEVEEVAPMPKKKGKEVKVKAAKEKKKIKNEKN